MKLFQERLLIPQDEDLRVDTLTVDPEDDEDVDYSNDDLGENTEITPLGDEVEEDDNDISGLYKIPGEDDDDLTEDDDLLLDDEEVDLDEDDEVVDIYTAESSPIDDEDSVDEDDDFMEDEDEEINPDVIPVVPDVDEDEDEGTWADDEDDELLSVDDDEEEMNGDGTGSSTAHLDPNFENRHPERKTGRMYGHEPGIQGFDGDF